MKDRKARISRVAIVGGIVILVLLLAVAQMRVAAGGPNSPSTSHFSYVAANATEDYTCTPGPTGGCNVEYLTYNRNIPFLDCGAIDCKVRVETRW